MIPTTKDLALRKSSTGFSRSSGLVSVARSRWCVQARLGNVAGVTNSWLTCHVRWWMKADCAGGHHGPEFLHLPKSSIPQWQAEYQAALLELDPTTSLRAGYSSGNRYLQSASIFRTTQTLMLSGRPSKMLCPASAFSRGTNLDFLTGKRSKNHAAAG